MFLEPGASGCDTGEHGRPSVGAVQLEALPGARHLPRNIIIIIIHLNPRSELEGARLCWRAGCVQHRGMSARQRGVAVVRSLALVLAFL